MSQPFMQLYVGDYIRDTMDLSTEEHGAYLLLLMTMWSHDAKLPNDHKKLARIARLSPAKFSRVWSGIERFFTVEGDHITQGRLTKEHKKAQEKGQKRAQAGAKGGKAKSLKYNDQALANATVLPKHLPEPEPEVKEEPKGSSQKKRASRLPDDWVLPMEWGQWAVSQGWPEEVVRVEAAKFRDYWIGVGGQKGRKLDWQATWRNWMRNSKSPKIVQGGQNGNRTYDTDRIQRIVSAAAGGTSRQDWG